MSEMPVTLEVATAGSPATVRGVFHLPAGPGRFPVVLWLHGFTGHRVESHRLFVEGARRLASRGVASLRIDFRGCGESDGDFADTTISTQVADAHAALAWLSAHDRVDAAAIALLGFSLGSTICSQLADVPGPLAMVLWSPVVFPMPIFARMGLYAAHPELSRQGWIDGGGLKVGRQFLAELSSLDPLGALASWRRPLYVLFGGEDMVATPENAEALLEEIEGAEGECLPMATHTFGTVRARSWLLERTENWLLARLASNSIVSL